VVRKVFGLIILLLTATPVVAGGIGYLVSDEGDMPLYEALSSRFNLVLNSTEGDVILALDLNYNFMGENRYEVLAGLLRNASEGKTVIIGLNTARSLKATLPQTLELLGIDFNFTGVGIIEIVPQNGLEFEPFGYDSDAYGIVITRAPGAKVLVESSGIPIVVEVPVKEGRLVVIAINPTAYYLDTQNPAVVEFIAAVVEYYSTFTVPVVAVLVLGVVGAVAYASTSRVERLRDVVEGLIVSIKMAPFLLARFMTPSKDVLKNDVRKEIYDYVRLRGYATINDVSSTLKISRTNARWHLSVLKRAKLLDETTVGNTIIFHPPGPENRRRAIRNFLLENRLRREIYVHLQKGKNLSEISKALRISKSTVHHHISILREYGIVGEVHE